MGLVLYMYWRSVYCTVEGIEPVGVVHGAETVRVREEEGEGDMVAGGEDHGGRERETGDGDIARGGQSAMYCVVGEKSKWVVVPKGEWREDNGGCSVGKVVLEMESKKKRRMGDV
jgi:hypothetical protein